MMKYGKQGGEKEASETKWSETISGSQIDPSRINALTIYHVEGMEGAGVSLM